MKVKLKKIKGEWHSGIYRGNGGISSMINSKITKSFWSAIRVFSPKNIYKALTW